MCYQVGRIYAGRLHYLMSPIESPPEIDIAEEAIRVAR